MIHKKVLGAGGAGGVIPGAWDLTTAVYSGRSFAFPGGDYHGIRWKPDGTKFYYCLASGTTNIVKEYNASTAWDISTLTFVQDSPSLTTNADDPNGIWFKPDGTKVYILSFFEEVIVQYSLTTPWDISTMSFDNKILDDSANEGNPYGIYIRSDGVQVFKMGFGQGVRQFSLSTAWDISTFSFVWGYNSQNLERDLYFTPDGLKMFIVNDSSTEALDDAVFEYDFTTPWDLTTVSFTGRKVVVKDQDSKPRAVDFKPNGTRMYMVGLNNGVVFEYEVGD